MNENPAADQSSAPQELQPGDTISPSATPSPELPAPPPAQPAPATAAPAASPDPAPPQPQPLTPEPALAAPLTGDPAEVTPAPLPDDDQPPLVEWQASEFMAHSKSPLWYLGLAAVTIVLAAVVLLLTRDKISTVVVLVAGLALGFYAGRKPRQLTYSLFAEGFLIGQKAYLYDQFRSFSLTDEGHLASIALVPHKRFGQLVTLYFDPRDEQPILGVISARLPLEKRTPDPIDSLLRKIRF